MQVAPVATPTPIPTWLTYSSGWIALGFLAFLGIAILYYIFTNRIDLSRLISEPNGDASMSRFQLLVFTFVIAASLFLIIAAPYPPRFPDVVPHGILILLGISASSYLVSKGIQFSTPEGVVGGGAQIKIIPSADNTTAGGNPILFKADVLGLTNTGVIWSLDPASGMGTIDANGIYLPPAKPHSGTPPTGAVVVKATSIEDQTVSASTIINIR